MLNISVRVLLVFVQVLFANSSINDCDTKGYGGVAIHACQDSSVSGQVVAMDASKFSGLYCECTLTTSKNASRDNVALVDVIYDRMIKRIQFSVDNIIYTNTSMNKLHNFNGDFIRVVVEKIHTRGFQLRTGNPCLIFKGRENANNDLTLSCFNGTDIDPRQSELKTSTANSEIEKITTQLQQSTRPTVPPLTITRTVKTTTTKPTTNTTTDRVKVSTNNLDLSSTTLYDLKSTTSVIQDFTTQSNKLQENVSTKFSGTFTDIIVIIIIVVVTVVCTANVVVLITCYCKRRKRSPIKSDENTITPSKEDAYDEVKENAMYVPMELLNEPNYTQGGTEHIYDLPDIDIIAIRAHENETKLVLHGQEASVYENEVKGTVEQSDSNATSINVVAKIEKNNSENQDHIPNEEREQLYTQLDKSKSSNTTSACTEHLYNVLGQTLDK